MKEILTALMIWLGANTPFDTNHDIPNIMFLSQTQMEEMFYKGTDKMPNTLAWSVRQGIRHDHTARHMGS